MCPSVLPYHKIARLCRTPISLSPFLLKFIFESWLRIVRDRGIEISRERVRESKYVSLKTHHFLSIRIQHATLFYCIVFKYAGLQLLRALRMWERKSCGFQKIRLLTHTHNAKPPHTLSLTHTYIHTYINAHIHTQARPSKPLVLPTHHLLCSIYDQSALPRQSQGAGISNHHQAWVTISLYARVGFCAS